VATGDYLVFLDGDDVLMPHALGVYDSIIDVRKPTLILGGMSKFTETVPWRDAKTTVTAPVRIVEYSRTLSKDRASDLSASTTVVEREAFFNVGGWTPDIFHGDNKDFLMKLGCAPLILILAPKTAFYRVHASNSIHNISSFLKAAHRLIDNERAGQYPGGKERLFERYAALGVFVVYWSLKGLTVGEWDEVANLVMDGFPMVLAGVVQRGSTLLRGLHSVERIEWGGLQ